MTFTQNIGPEPDNPKMQSDRRAGLARRCFQLALVLFVIGLVPGFLAFWGQRRAAAAAVWRDPADNIQVAAVAADLALLTLAGVPDDQVLALAMEKGELATTHALLALSADLADAQRMNGWVWLAYCYHKAGQTQRAAQAYRLAGYGAILSPDLHDLLRTETLLAVGKGLVDLHDNSSARFYLKQAAIIGANSPRLTAYHRRSLLERLVPASLRAGGKRDDWSGLAKAVKNGTAAGGNLAGSTSGAGPEWHDVPADNDAAIVHAQDARRVAAADWLQTMTASRDATESPTSSDTDHQEALQAALLAEEAALDRSADRKQVVHATSLYARQARLRWLSLKRRIAAGGVGAGLVPGWESNREAIDAALTAAWTNWLALHADSAGGGLPDAFQARQAIVAAYWGLYPDAPVADLVSALEPTRGFGGLRLTILESGEPPVVGWSE